MGWNSRSNVRRLHADGNHKTSLSVPKRLGRCGPPQAERAWASGRLHDNRSARPLGACLRPMPVPPALGPFSLREAVGLVRRRSRLSAAGAPANLPAPTKRSHTGTSMANPELAAPSPAAGAGIRLPVGTVAFVTALYAVLYLVWERSGWGSPTVRDLVGNV